MKRSSFSICAVAMLLTACQRKANIDPPFEGSKLFINSTNATNSLIGADIGRTYPVLNASTNVDDYRVKTALVLLYQNGVLADTLKYNTTANRYTGSKIRVAGGITYKLAVTANGFEATSAESFTPTVVPVKIESRVRAARVNKDGEKQDALTVSFTDPGATTDYYLFRIRDAAGNFIFCINTYDADIERLVNDNPLDNDQCLDGNKLILSDKSFNGTAKRILFYVNSAALAHVDPVRPRKPYIELLHINADQYKYMKSSNNYENTRDNPFAEPVNLYSNIKNGYGIFTSFTAAVDSVR